MIDALVAGKLFGKPELRTSQGGRNYVKGKLRVATRGDESIFVGLVCFSRTLGEALAAMDDGDSVACSGELSLRGYLDKHGQPQAGVDLVVAAFTTAHHMARKRDAQPRYASRSDAGQDAPAESPAPQASEPKPFNDEVPF